MARIRPRAFEQCSRTPTEQEDRVARVVRGHRQRGSGASMYAKGDVSSDHFLIECKRTEHASLSLKKAWLDKISREAAAVSKEPALAIEIAGGPDDAHGSREWIMIPLRVFRKMTEVTE